MPGHERPPRHRALSVAEALPLLHAGEVRLLGRMPRASNATFLCEVLDESGRAPLAVYKPRDGETPLWDFPDGTLCLREQAAFEVSEALAWGLVPPTVLRDGPLGFGALQLFVDADPREHALTLAPSRAGIFRRVAAFDALINNGDRKSGHCLLERGTEEIRLVDHGVAFHERPNLRTVVWEFAGEPVPPPVLDDVRRFATALTGPVGERLGALLSARETAALAGRARDLAARGTYPEPGPGRPYPWPPV